MRPLTKIDPTKDRKDRRRVKAVYFDYQSLSATADSDIYCLSDSTVQMAYALLVVYGGWRNRFVVDTQQAVWKGLLDDEWAQAQDWCEKALEELKTPMCEQLMEKLDGLIAAVNGLDLNVTVDGGSSSGQNGASDDMTTVINNYGCGCGCEGQSSTTTTDTTPQNTFNPEGVDGPVNQQPPAGFDQWGDYTDYKCKAAHQLFDQMLDWFGHLDSAAGTASIAGVANGLNFIAGLRYYWMTSETMSSLATNLFNWTAAVEQPPTFWVQLQRDVLRGKDYFICLMYNSPNTTALITDLTDAIEDYVDALLSSLGISLLGPVKGFAMELVGNAVGPSLLNDLFQGGIELLDNTDKSCDCGQELPSNTGVCYAMNTQSGLGQASLVSDDGSTQVWRVYPDFDAGVYKIDLQAVNGSNQINYQVTAVDEHSNPPGGHDLIEYNMSDTSQHNAITTGCVENIRYQSVRPGWFIDVTVNLLAMNNCAGCFSALSELFFATSFGSVVPSGASRLGSGNLARDGSVRTLSSVPYEVSGVVTGHVINISPIDGDYRYTGGQVCPGEFAYKLISTTASNFSWTFQYDCVSGVITEDGPSAIGGTESSCYGVWFGTNTGEGPFTIDIELS